MPEATLFPLPPLPPSLDGIDEATWQKQVIDLARLLGWRVAHFRPAQTSKGWRTAVAADGQGYPDLTLVRDRALFIECKREKTHITADQAGWLAALEHADAEVYVVRPRNLTALAEVLRHRGRPHVAHSPHVNELLAELATDLQRHAA